MSRTAMHSVATVTSVLFALRMGLGGPWWSPVLWYCGSFVGVHVVAVPFMSAWQSWLSWVERRMRAIVEEELMAFDMRTYERQFRRVFPSHPEPPPGDAQR